MSERSSFYNTYARVFYDVGQAIGDIEQVLGLTYYRVRGEGSSRDSLSFPVEDRGKPFLSNEQRAKVIQLEKDLNSLKATLKLVLDSAERDLDHRMEDADSFMGYSS